VSFMMQGFVIDLEAIRMAAKRIAGQVIRTPVVTAPLINDEYETQIFFKCENLQHIGAFKARGACNAVNCLTEAEAAAGVVTHSSGNHAAALARAAKLRGIAAHIVMPHNSASVKVQAVRRYGVEPTFCELTAQSRQATADHVAETTGATFVHPYDNANVMAGQGSVVLELLEQTSDLDAIVVPVGGGGLLAGTLVAAKSINPHIKIFAAEPAWADDAFRSLQSGRIEQPLRYDSIADGLRTPLGTLTFPIINALVDQVLVVTEEAIEAATRNLIMNAKLVVEPSGAVPLAAIALHSDLFRGLRVGVIVSGGNLDPQTLARLTVSVELNV